MNKEIKAESGVESARKYKVVLLGNYGVGKTTLFRNIMTRSFCSTEDNINKHNDSQSVVLTVTDIKSPADVKLVYDNVPIFLEIWDTEDQEKYNTQLPSIYYKNVNTVIYMFDLTNRKSFEDVAVWMEAFAEANKDDEVYSLLVGNKIDSKAFIEVSQDEVFDVFSSAVDVIEFITATEDDSIKNLLYNVCSHLLEGDEINIATNNNVQSLSYIKKIEHNCFYQ